MRFLSLPSLLSLLFCLSTACASDGSNVQHSSHGDAVREGPHELHADSGVEGAAGHGAKGHHRFDDAEKWAKIFENPARDAWQKPDVVIDFMKIEPKMRVADIGSATGYFPVRIARRFPESQVVGLDVEQTLVDHLNARAKTEGMSNLSSRKVPFDDATLDEDTHRVLVVDTYHHIADRVNYLKKLSLRLNPEGTVCIVDFKKVELPFGGPPAAMRMTAKEVQQEFEEAGFVLDENDSESLAYQYMLRFRLAK